MKNTEDKPNKLMQALLWSCIAIFTLLAFFVTYSFALSTPIIAIVWILWLLASLGMASLTSIGKQVLSFGLEAKGELDKVVWPTRQETIQTTAIVMTMVGLTGFILWGVDSAMMWIIGKLTHLG